MLHFAERATQDCCGRKRFVDSVDSVVGEVQVGHPFQPGHEHNDGTPARPAAAIWTCARRQRRCHVEYYYSEDPEAKRQRKKFSQVTINEKVVRALEKNSADTKAEAVRASVAACRDEVASVLTSLIPSVVSWLQQNPNEAPTNFPMPSFTGSNSMNTALTLVPAMATAHAPTPTPAPAPSSHSSPRSISGLNVGPSTFSELDPLTVNTRRTLINTNNINLPFPFFLDL